MPIAPPAVETEVGLPAYDDTGNLSVSEDTKSLEVPDPELLVTHMLQLVASEAEALLVGDDADGKLADLNIRIALASWDGLNAPDEAMRHLELAEHHPLAARLRLVAGLADPSPRLLEAVEASPDIAVAPELGIELAEVWMFRRGEPARAAALVDRVVATYELSPAWRAHALELSVTAHAMAGNWSWVVELRRAGHDPGGAPDEIAATAALVLDRTDDAAAALQLCWSAIERLADEAPPTTLGWLRLVDVAIDAAWRARDARRLELLELRGRLVERLADGELEALATRHAIAAQLDHRDRRDDAAAAWAQLGEAEAAKLPGAALRVALLSAAYTNGAAGKRAAALAARRRLVDSDCSEVRATHAWRALELAAASGEPLGELPHVVYDSSESLAAERWVDLTEFAAPTIATVARVEARGGLALRWAATLAERAGAGARAVELWRRAAQLPDRLGTEHDHVVRLVRTSDDDDALPAAYAAWAAAERHARIAAALHCGRGVVELTRGDFVEAEESLRRAAELDPSDPFCRAALSAVYRAGKRYDQLSATLSELSRSLSSGDARAAAAREHAELLDSHIGDPAGARAALERLVADRPEDDDAMLALARLYDRDQQWDRSLDLRRRAVELAQEPERRAEQWIDIAVREERRGDQAAALDALDHAIEADPQSASALRERARIHRSAGRHEAALVAVRQQLALEPARARQLQLRVEEAQLLVALDRDLEGAVAAYLEVLAIYPDRQDLLTAIEAPARQLNAWDALARAFGSAPPTAHNLEVLAEALEVLGAWSQLADVRRKQLELAATPADKAARASALARLYEQELDDLTGAVTMLQLAQSAAPDDRRQAELARVLRNAGRWPELALVLERELASPRIDAARKLALLVELGSVRADKLDRPTEAVTTFEAVLEREPGHTVASERLEKLYERLGRDRELARLLEARAATLTDGAARAIMLARVGQLRGNRGDVDAAIEAYLAAIQADPANRDVFTALEHICYKTERWKTALQLYDIAIAHVEGASARAYRLGDLFARRGNVELQFLGQVEAAIASYQRVVEVDSQPQGAVKILEDLCARRGDFTPLLEAWERRGDHQRDLQRRVDALRAAAAVASERIGDPRTAMRLQRKLLELDPSDKRTASLLEKYFEDEQDRSGLVAVLKLRLDGVHDEAERVGLMKRIARASEEGARDVDTATEHYQKVLELQPENRDALDALGRIYESTEQWAELIEVTRRLIKVTNDRNLKALLYFKCGSVMEAKFGRESDAMRYYEAAIKTSQNCLPAVHGLRDMLRKQGEWARVIETLELEVKLWTDDKERAGVFAQIGKIHEQQLGDAERALQFYESALTVDPDCLPANQALFEHYFAAGEWAKAQEIGAALAQRAIRDGDPTTRSELCRKRGVVARMTGDFKAAADSFVGALEIKPLHIAALDDLGELAREQPDVWDFEATYKELEKVYKKRDDADALLARVYTARAAMLEHDGDLDAAAALYRQALELAPTDLAILSALVDFHADMRRWEDAVAAIEHYVHGGARAEDRVAALMRQASLHADGQMDAAQAIAVLRQVIALEPSQEDAHYLLAQEYFLLASYTEARTAIDRVIELASAADQPLSPEALARYYYYKGRILDAAGDARAAAPQYRRAIDYDPGYAPPALVLARRAAEQGDQQQAETLLLETAHAAMEQGGQHAAVPLQRGLARMLLASGDRPAAIEAYRGILAVEPDGASDRVALAEIYAVDDPTRAIGELRKVIDRDIHHAPAYRLLASFYTRTGEVERAHRVLTALDLLGFAEQTDRESMDRLRGSRRAPPLRRGLDADSRERLLLTEAANAPLGEVWSVFAEELSSRIAQPTLGENLAPAATLGERVRMLAAEVGALFQVEVDVFVADRVPGLFAVTSFPRRLLVVDRSLLGEQPLALRFLFGYAYEAIRGRYAPLLQLGARSRRELAQWLRALLSPGDQTGPAAELVDTASPRAAKVLERHAGTRDLDVGQWIDGMLSCAKRAGLLACDDFGAAIWMIARLAGERLGGHDEAAALGAVLGGPDLVRFYLSDQYQRIRDLLASQ
jgi:tetratricopeptide (TPR) repeat protein